MKVGRLLKQYPNDTPIWLWLWDPMVDSSHGKYTVGEIKRLFGDCYTIGGLTLMYGKNLNITILSKNDEKWLSQNRPDILEIIKFGKS